jgi:hypothetical protein
LLASILETGSFASIPSPIKKTFIGSKNPYTSVASIVGRSFGLQAAKQVWRGVNRWANVITVGQIGYLGGLEIHCAAVCAADPSAY